MCARKVSAYVCWRAGFQAREQKHFSTGDGSLRVSSTLILLAAHFPFNHPDVFFFFFFLAKSSHRRFFPPLTPFHQFPLI